jgi:hypothetical protein
VHNRILSTLRITLVSIATILFCASSEAQTPLGSASPDIRVYKTVGPTKLTAHIFHALQIPDGKRGDKAPAADLSPDEHISKRLPPTLIFHGISDTLVPIAGVRRFCERANQHSSNCEIVEYPNVGHLFTRKLDSQENDFDPDPSDVADTRAKGDAFLARQGFLPKFSDAQQVPQQLQPPAGEKLLLQVHAKGDQIYVCKEDVTQYTWTLKAPDAKLFDKDGKPFGKHFAGPSWEANDGSRVTGKATANVLSPDADAIPWLLVNIVAHEGTGILSRATSIQRLNTKGGKAPATGCDSSHVGQELRVAYSADYLFYAPK